MQRRPRSTVSPGVQTGEVSGVNIGIETIYRALVAGRHESPPHTYRPDRPYTALTRLTSRVYCSESTASPLLLLLLVLVLGGELGVGLYLVRVRLGLELGLGLGYGFGSEFLRKGRGWG